MSVDLSEEDEARGIKDSPDSIPYYYVYNKDDNEMLKEQKFRLR